MCLPQIIAFFKFEYRNPKSETNPKSKYSNDQNDGYTDIRDRYVSVIWILVIRNCFDFRASDFGFMDLFSAMKYLNISVTNLIN